MLLFYFYLAYFEQRDADIGYQLPTVLTVMSTMASIQQTRQHPIISDATVVVVVVIVSALC